MLERQDRFRVDQNAFCRALKRVGDSNPVAANFSVYPCVTGFKSWEFDDSLVMAQSACLSYFEMPEFTHVKIQISKRLAKKFIGERPEAARELVDIYLEELRA